MNSKLSYRISGFFIHFYVFFLHFFSMATALEDILQTHTKKVDSIKNVIWQTGLKSNNISSLLNTLGSNETRQFLDATVETSKMVSAQMREVRRVAVDISSDVFKLKLKLASLEPQWSVKFGLAEENGKCD